MVLGVGGVVGGAMGNAYGATSLIDRLRPRGYLIGRRGSVSHLIGGRRMACVLIDRSRSDLIGGR